MPNQHVVPNSNGGWDVKSAGASKATKHLATQSDAINFAKIIATNQKSELNIHGRNGQIRAKNSYGNDPRNIKG